jgi:ATP-dependent RNA helicase SUPV3L1/SUV3
MWTQSFIDGYINQAQLPAQEAQRVRKSFLGTKPRQANTTLDPEQFAQDLIWGAQCRLIEKKYTERCSLAGDRKKPLLVLRLQITAKFFETTHQTTLYHAVPLPAPLAAKLLSAPAESFTEVAPKLVEAEAKQEVERELQKLSDEMLLVLEVPGFPKEELEEAIWHTLRKPGRLDMVLAKLRDKKQKLLQRTKEASALQSLLSQQNFQNYAEHFPLARSMKREFILYVGPTNSGKTYQALNHLAEAESGAYLAPLRLLALEGQEELEKRGRPTSFLTGEERDLKTDTNFISSTIEMFDLRREVEVAVIDEVQLLSDPDRGWAWSAAIIGAPAKKIVLTGSPEVVPLVEALAAYLQEPLTVHRLERFTPLYTKRAPDRLDSLEPGSAVICFSRRDCLGLKQMIEAKRRVSVIYGNLSPQVRREEARRFRSGESEIVVATDAIALGLNLPIQQVIFYTVNKWNGHREVTLSPKEIRQIGGRAGRFGKSSEGFVGALSRKDLKLVHGAFEQDVLGPLLRVQVRPSLFHINALHKYLGVQKLAPLLETFQRRMRFDDPLLVTANIFDMLTLAAVVDEFQLSLEEKFTFACAPFDAKNENMLRALRRWLKLFAAKQEIRLDNVIPIKWTTTTAEDQDDLYLAEQEVKLLTAYAWLSYRFSEHFTEIEACEVQRRMLNDFIERTLRKTGLARRCSSCRGPLPPLHPFSICDKCHQQSWFDEDDDFNDIS